MEKYVPQYAPKTAAKAPETLYTCVNTNAVFAATFPCILFRFWRQKKSTAVSGAFSPQYSPKTAAKAPKTDVRRV